MIFECLGMLGSGDGDYKNGMKMKYVRVWRGYNHYEMSILV